MTSDGLERELEQLSDGGGPPAGWREKVLAGVDGPAPPERRAVLWPIALAGSVLAVAAAAVLLVVGLRGPEPTRSRGPAAVDPGPAQAEKAEQAIDRIDDAVENLMQARTEMERAAAERALREATKDFDTAKRVLDKARRVKWPKRDDGKLSVKCDPNDPLCGLE